ncbi:MAG: sugar ABC transporter ATP-binding protein [Pontimonas sp.]
MSNVLVVEELSKSFPGVKALDKVNITLRAGEVQALLGENGAGKSTLIKILTGVYQTAEGQVILNGSPVSFDSPLAATKAGIGVVHQERNLIPYFSVAENIVLQEQPSRYGLIDVRKRNEKARKALDSLGLTIDPDEIVQNLSVAQMQLVEIAKALATETRVLLLDEPTASISGSESTKLFSVVAKLREQGTAVLFVSHKLEEVFEVCDTVTVLRDGESVIESSPLADYSRSEIVAAMVGRTLADRAKRFRDVEPGEPALELRNVSTVLGHEDVSLSLLKGEVLGLYGLVGAGRSELVRSVLGLHSILSGQILLNGQVVKIRDVREALHRYRIGYVTENRKEEGLFLEFTINRNIAVTVWRKLQAWLGVVSHKKETEVSERFVESLGIRISSVNQLAGNLSGGNQQKVSLAKWLAAETEIIVIDEPTVGIDVRTKANFHELIMDLADQGMAVLLISSDLPEMVSIADRIMVMRDYQFVGEFANSKDYAEMSTQVMEAIQSGSKRIAAV